MKIEIIETNYVKSSKYLCDELNKCLIKNKNNINNIVSNGNICSILQDNNLYKYKLSLKNENEQYFSIGDYNNINLFVDKFQLWTDNKILLKNNKTIIEEIKIIDNNRTLI